VSKLLEFGVFYRSLKIRRVLVHPKRWPSARPRRGNAHREQRWASFLGQHDSDKGWPSIALAVALLEGHSVDATAAVDCRVCSNVVTVSHLDIQVVMVELVAHLKPVVSRNLA
jgi:hypothetical protein